MIGCAGDLLQGLAIGFHRVKKRFQSPPHYIYKYSTLPSNAPSMPHPNPLHHVAMGKKQADEEPHVSGQANKPISQPPHALPHATVTDELRANADDGLTDQEAKSRLDEYGRNELDDGPGVQPVKILIRQVANAMMLVKLPQCWLPSLGGSR